jgi:Mechanosensitive ion channel
MQAHDGRQLSHDDEHPRTLRNAISEKAGVPDMHDLQVQVALVKAKTRPWKSIIALVLAILAAGASSWAHSYFRRYFAGDDVNEIIAAATAVGFCLFASVAVVGLSSKARSVLEPVIGIGHAAVVRYTLVLVGELVVLVVTLLLFGIPVGQLILGGALTTVFVSIAAQQALGNVFSGIVLLLARPFNVGDAIRMRAGALSGEIDGTVTEIGITYLRMSTSNGPISIPNSQVLNAVVGPLPAGAYPPAPPVPPPPVWPTPAPAPVPGYASAPSPATTSPAPSPVTAPSSSADGSSAGPVGTADGAGGDHRPGFSGEQ